MAELLCCGKTITMDNDGFMSHPEDWDDCVAETIARQEGIEHISPEQMAIVRFMRSYYAKFHSFPILNYVCREVRQSSRCVFNEFDNPEIAWKIAGLPKFDGVHFVKLDGEHFIMEDYC
ncbi:TusE/DsrC/DsvC family sulfur relay protein [Desulforhopalus sp. IMCC35007]|uniref:TusE/DsrC/DsvC family sulfur relay protein n=1 Tax=Desulforhopalus sp. IMCC35007 TaxID=2569543 RepID=UPI0010AE59E4|nr:TusE/DsrC/DsvC family sulfur relay protein [Desulforhopalus sp. IMCC35007]TKB08008.1 sulfur relay protein DsrC [Desulforhopalus sp. IMCC35007]